jgi:hypothetical protein
LGLTANPKAIFSTGNVTIVVSRQSVYSSLASKRRLRQLCLMAQQLKKHFRRPTGVGVILHHQNGQRPWIFDNQSTFLELVH